MKEVSSSVHDGKENIITPTEAPVGENVQSDISGKSIKSKNHKFIFTVVVLCFSPHRSLLNLTQTDPTLFFTRSNDLRPLKLNVWRKSRNCTRAIEAIIFIKGHDIAEKVYFCC